MVKTGYFRSELHKKKKITTQNTLRPKGCWKWELQQRQQICARADTHTHAPTHTHRIPVRKRRWQEKCFKKQKS